MDSLNPEAVAAIVDDSVGWEDDYTMNHDDAILALSDEDAEYAMYLEDDLFHEWLDKQGGE